MKLRNILKIGVVAGLLILALSLTGYAASITEVTGTDGTNAFVATEGAVTAYTPLESDLNVSGTVDTAEANVTIMISAEDTVVYVNQTVADTDGAFAFDFPVVLEGGYTYEVKVNTENSDTATSLYFATEEDEPPHYGDLNADGKVNTSDTSMLMRKLGGSKPVSAKVEASYAEGLGDINGDDKTNTSDTSMLMRKLGGSKPVSAKIEARLAWYFGE